MRARVDVDQLVALYTSGMALSEVARAVHRSESVVYRHLVARGVPIRGRTSRRAKRQVLPDTAMSAPKPFGQAFDVIALPAQNRGPVDLASIAPQAKLMRSRGLTYGQIAIRIGVSTQKARKAALWSGSGSTGCGHEHIAYQSNCKGSHCRSGKARYMESRRAAIRLGAAEVGQHGTGGYRQGCRCDTCRTAVREQRRAEREAKRQAQ